MDRTGDCLPEALSVVAYKCRMPHRPNLSWIPTPDITPCGDGPLMRSCLVEFLLEACLADETVPDDTDLSWQDLVTGAVESTTGGCCNRSEEQLPSDRGVKSVYAAVLSQVVGGRNWSAQEVGHVAMGCPTVVCSHQFEEVYLAGKRKQLRKDIKADTADDAPAFQLNSLDKYFGRIVACASSTHTPGEGDQTSLLDHGFQGVLDPFKVDVEHVASCSFTEFWRMYKTSSDGPNKRTFKVARRLEPTVVNIKPRLPARMLHSQKPEEKSEYCRVMLLLHRPFADRAEYEDLMMAHEGDFVAAYEQWATDPLEQANVPPRVRDDFRDVLLEDDGTHAHPDELPGGGGERPDVSREHGFYEFLGRDRVQEAMAATLPLFSEWGARTSRNYSAEKVADANMWMNRAKSQPLPPMPAPPIAIESLNPNQRFVYNVFHNHFHTAGPKDALRALICGTAGSGKTYLIGALKQLLGDECKVCAPTGVAADNIGGMTYQSVLPMPGNKCLDKLDVRVQTDSEREKKLHDDLRGVRYVIIDEMSMVGRRSLGQIDELLQQAKGYPTGSGPPFGGVSVLLVGDHGQLPPVLDSRAYDWSGVRHRRQGKTFGDKIEGSPKWQFHGTKMYELFDAVFYLDKIERVATADASDAHGTEAELLQRFRELQLRARDGELTREDYDFIVENMDASKRPQDFEGADVYRLVCTRAQRDEKNLEALSQQVHGGALGISIPSINSSAFAERAEDDELGLAKWLLLCIGARVMVTKNVSVKNGLCNGTMGTVCDILCDRDDKVVTVLVRVKKRTDKRRGYVGPSFLTNEELPQGIPPLEDDEAIIALDRWTVTVLEDKTEHSRSQFPLMLCAAVTIHKSQGLTLGRVLIDAGPDEHAMGQFFVALSRVRHPHHVAFQPLPPLERVTTLIARKASLFERKRHECFLRKCAEKTAQRFANEQPAGFEVGAVPAAPERYKAAPDPMERQTGKQRQQTSLTGYLRKPQSHEGDSDAAAAAAAAAARAQQKAKQVRQVAAVSNRQRVAQRQFDVNQNAVTRLGLPLIQPVQRDGSGGSDVELPGWLVSARPALTLKAHIVDYLDTNSARSMVAYMQSLGFEVHYESQERQTGCTCGVVAARAAVDLCLSHAAEEAGSWFSRDTSRAVEAQWYQAIYPLIGLRSDDLQKFITGEQVTCAASHFWNAEAASVPEPEQTYDADGNPQCCRCGHAHRSVECPWHTEPATPDIGKWLEQPESHDFTLRQMVEDLHGVATGTRDSIDFKIRIANTDDCRRTGTHWITIAYSIVAEETNQAILDAHTQRVEPMSEEQVAAEHQLLMELMQAHEQALQANDGAATAGTAGTSAAHAAGSSSRPGPAEPPSYWKYHTDVPPQHKQELERRFLSFVEDKNANPAPGQGLDWRRDAPADRQEQVRDAIARSMWQQLFGASGGSGRLGSAADALFGASGGSGRLGSATDAHMTCPTCGGTEFEADEDFVVYCPVCCGAAGHTDTSSCDHAVLAEACGAVNDMLEMVRAVAMAHSDEGAQAQRMSEWATDQMKDLHELEAEHARTLQHTALCDMLLGDDVDFFSEKLNDLSVEIHLGRYTGAVGIATANVVRAASRCRAALTELSKELASAASEEEGC